MATRPHIFFATITAGGGHMATAKALAEALAADYPGVFETTISDYMLELGLTEQDRRHKESWSWMLAHPRSARYGQRVLDAFPRLTNRAHRLMLDTFARRAAAHLNELKPALVVANHGWSCVALTRARRRYGLQVPVLTFTTEVLDASALWAEPAAERFAVPSQAALKDLERLGVPEQNIDLVGYPVQNACLRAPSQVAARISLGLEERLTCLVSLGGEGVGLGTEGVVRTLLAHPLKPQIVVATGRNGALKKRLERFGGVRALGFTDHMAEYLAACDVVVGKAGPASVTEALAVGRGVLVTSYAGLNEAKLVRFLERKGLGAYVPGPAQLAARLHEFASASVRGRVAERSAALGLSAMTRDLSRYVADAATVGFPRTPLRLRGFG